MTQPTSADSAWIDQPDDGVKTLTPASPQVDATHYDFARYLQQGRWNAYWHQIEEVATSQARTVLVIGVGDGLVPHALRSFGLEVSTFDFDPALQPTYLGDVRRLGEIVDGRSFDAIVCCQVLEHLPFTDFAPTLSQLYALTRRRLVVSLPYCHLRLGKLVLKLPRLPALDVVLTLPRFWRRWRFDGQHHWEIGAAPTPMSKVRATFQRLDGTLRSYFATDFCYHRFFIVDRAR